MNFDQWWAMVYDNPDEDNDLKFFARAAWEAYRDQLDPETMSVLCGRYMAQYRDKERTSE